LTIIKILNKIKNMKKISIIFLILLLFSCNKRQGNNKLEDVEKEENYYIYNMLRFEEFYIDIDCNDNNIFLLKTWTYKKNSMFTSDFIGNDNFKFTELYRSRYREYDRKDRVLIAYTKEDLEFIELNYINSKYLKAISSNYFDENIMVFVSFYYGSTEYPKNIKIIKEIINMYFQLKYGTKY
jgi:hypothetical protein